MITREDYLENGSELHRAYYAQFITPEYRSRVIARIGKDRILKSTDKHLNDIALYLWDNLVAPVPYECDNLMRACGDYPTKAGCVCILKEIARQIIDEAETDRVNTLSSCPASRPN